MEFQILWKSGPVKSFRQTEREREREEIIIDMFIVDMVRNDMLQNANPLVLFIQMIRSNTSVVLLVPA